MRVKRRHLLQNGLFASALGALSTLGRAFADPSATGNFRLMQGPMIGFVSPTTALIHVRTSADCTVRIAYGTQIDAPLNASSAAQHVGADNDYTAVLELKNLTPDTRYFYRVMLDDKMDGYTRRNDPFSFKTAPSAGKPAPFSVAFGSCARIQAANVQPIWDAVASVQPDLFLWLGDNVYHDTLEPRIMDDMWRWQRSVANLQPLLRSIPQLAIWDDHDYGLNDHDRTNPVKDLALKSFKKHWANPGYGLEGTPGCFFSFSYAHIDFFMTDGRYYRDPNAAPDTPEKTLLGKHQLQWLKQGLKDSRAMFKIVACGSGWSGAKGPGGDSWAAFLHERKNLFDFIRDEKIEGVVLLSGDTHVGELNCIPASETGGYDLYDLVSSPLAQDTETGWTLRRPERRVRQVYASDVNFGLLRFEMTPEPRLVYNLYNSQAQTAWQPLILTPKDLKNGVKSWDTKMDAPSKARYDNILAGRDYYQQS
jgi:alkaline phosphatase D